MSAEPPALRSPGLHGASSGEAGDERPVLLLVDDEPGVRAALVHTLRRDGYQILTAHDAAARMTLLDQQVVDVVVADQRMPGQKGTDFLAAVRDRYPNVVRLVLSGVAEPEDIEHGISTGAIYKHLKKPLEPARLRSHVAEACAHAAAVRKAVPRPAWRDSLTGLPSAAYLQRVFGSLRRESGISGASICMLLVQFDGCGRALERFAPDFADDLMRAASRVLRRGLSPDMFLCPQFPGGFLVLTTDTDPRARIESLGRTLQGLFASALTVCGRPVTLTLKLGATVADADLPFDVLVNEARAAAMSADERTTVRIFDRAGGG